MCAYMCVSVRESLCLKLMSLVLDMCLEVDITYITHKVCFITNSGQSIKRGGGAVVLESSCVRELHA